MSFIHEYWVRLLLRQKLEDFTLASLDENIEHFNDILLVKKSLKMLRPLHEALGVEMETLIWTLDSQNFDTACGGILRTSFPVVFTLLIGLRWSQRYLRWK